MTKIKTISMACSGYMSPEYALDGVFSTKSDVFSFGVLLLEIITGKKNTRIFNDDDSPNLIKYVSSMLLTLPLQWVIFYIDLILEQLILSDEDCSSAY